MMETSCIKTGYRSNSFDIRKRQAVEVGKYEAENGSKSVLYRDREGYFLEECNLHPAIDESDKSVVGILTSKAYPFDRLDAYEWAREGHCDPSVLLAEFYDDNPDDIEGRYVEVCEHDSQYHYIYLHCAEEDWKFKVILDAHDLIIEIKEIWLKERLQYVMENT